MNSDAKRTNKTVSNCVEILIYSALLCDAILVLIARLDGLAQVLLVKPRRRMISDFNVGYSPHVLTFSQPDLALLCDAIHDATST